MRPIKMFSDSALGGDDTFLGETAMGATYRSVTVPARGLEDDPVVRVAIISPPDSGGKSEAIPTSKSRFLNCSELRLLVVTESKVRRMAVFPLTAWAEPEVFFDLDVSPMEECQGGMDEDVRGDFKSPFSGEVSLCRFDGKLVDVCIGMRRVTEDLEVPIVVARVPFNDLKYVIGQTMDPCEIRQMPLAEPQHIGDVQSGEILFSLKQRTTILRAAFSGTKPRLIPPKKGAVQPSNYATSRWLNPMENLLKATEHNMPCPPPDLDVFMAFSERFVQPGAGLDNLIVKPGDKTRDAFFRLLKKRAMSPRFSEAGTFRREADGNYSVSGTLYRVPTYVIPQFPKDGTHVSIGQTLGSYDQSRLADITSGQAAVEVHLNLVGDAAKATMSGSTVLLVPVAEVYGLLTYPLLVGGKPYTVLDTKRIEHCYDNHARAFCFGPVKVSDTHVFPAGPCDLDIHDQFRDYSPPPSAVITDLQVVGL